MLVLECDRPENGTTDLIWGVPAAANDELAWPRGTVNAVDDDGDTPDDEDDDLIDVPLPEPSIEDDEEFDENDFDDDFDEDFEDEPDEDLLEFERELEGEPIDGSNGKDDDDVEFDEEADF